MKVLAEYIVPFSGMKVGKHQFDYKVRKEFFDAFEYSEIKDGDLDVIVEVDKSETMMIMNFSIEGSISLECDVCLGELKHLIAAKYRQIFKFSDDEDLKLDDEITYVRSTEFEVNIAPFIIEFINLSKPNKSRHENGECDEELLAVLDEYLLVEEEQIEESMEEEEVDPRWNALKKLKTNN
ncbi:MAG: DUF177 domain-containing protein [Flavobacteriales bacterium]|jgi:uncharacterized metal-binding protein YceD (DUF177 family)|nr:DUF177 domain-containing protein [Flavobacteriales bacterium]